LLYLLIYNTQVVCRFLDPCSPIRVEDKFRRDDKQGRNRLKKRVIPAEVHKNLKLLDSCFRRNDK
jgi:hypothetical protein